MSPAPRFFTTAEEFRDWLHAHHASEPELLVGFWKTHTGRPSISWPESVDEALCVGWNPPASLPAAAEKQLRAQPAAWAFWQAQPPWYRRTATWWVISAKRESTREKRLAQLIADSAAQRLIGPLARKPRDG